MTPGEAARYLHKTQCFCFDQQTLGAGERKEMPMIFYLDPELPRHINTLTLSYTIFDVTDRVAATNDAALFPSSNLSRETSSDFSRRGLLCS